jgi:hypothetical protein
LSVLRSSKLQITAVSKPRFGGAFFMSECFPASNQGRLAVRSTFGRGFAQPTFERHFAALSVGLYTRGLFSIPAH